VRRTPVLRAGAILLGLAMLAAGCGGDDSNDSSSVSTSAAPATSAGSSTTAATATTAAGAQPASMDEWEALWAKQRDAVVKRIKDNKWGKSADGKTVTGPAGFTMDLTKCPAGWSDTEGLTDTSIKIGQTIAQSGTLADYGNLGKAINVLFDYYGKKGAFKDSLGKTRTVNYIQKDDGYDPARTIPLVDELLDSEKVFSIWTLGSPNTLKVYDKINQRCVPHPLAMTGHPAWADPVNHPWTTGPAGPSYSTEAILWGAFIEQHINELPAGKFKVASLVINNDFGNIYDASFKSVIANSAILKERVDYVSEKIEASTPTVTDPMTTMAAQNPAVFIAMVAGTPCTQAVTEAAQDGLHEKAKFLFQPATCQATSFVSKEKVGGDGSASNGWWIVNPAAKDIKDPTQANDPFIKWARDLLQSNGIDPNSSASLGTGFGYGWPMVQFLQIAGQLDGGLTRTNLILAQRAIDMTDPYLLSGVRMHMDGNKDAYFAEGAIYQKWDSTKQAYVSQGQLIDLDGKSSLCAWNQATASCG
jgi:branched-chain amino acid transport system substrate-binding protein